MNKLEQAALAAPDGYALVSIDALKAWGKYDEVRNACQFSAEQAEQEPVACKSVPIEPTEDMLLAAELSQPRGYRELYAAMINAAPVQQAEQKPVAAYKDAPRVIYLQTGCEDPEFCECSFNEWGDTTWCADKIHDTDIPYIREDYTAPVRTKDLTDDEISDAIHGKGSPLRLHDYAIRDFRAVIDADREKNKC